MADRATLPHDVCPNCGAAFLVSDAICSVPCDIFSRWEPLTQFDRRQRRRRFAAFMTSERVALGCSRCHDNAGEAESLDVHHLRYGVWGSEDDDHLVLLCRRCHDAIHQLLAHHGYTVDAARLRAHEERARALWDDDP